MESAVVIKPVSPDRPDVVALIQDLDDFLSGLYPPENNHFLDIADLLQDNIYFLVAEHEGLAIGCGAFRRGQGYAEIKRMYVAPKYQGRGIGYRILAELERKIREEGYTVIRLETGDLNTQALSLYKKMGFYPIAAFGEYCDDPLARCFEKTL